MVTNFWLSIKDINNFRLRIWKKNSLVYLIKQKNDDEHNIIDKISIYVDTNDAKYQYVIKQYQDIGLKEHEDPRALIEYSNNMQDVYKNIDEYSPGGKRKILVVFNCMIADMISNRKSNQIVTEIYTRRIKLNISTVFIGQSYFIIPKDIRLNRTNFSILKTPNNLELQKIAFSHSSDIEFEDFMVLHWKCYAKVYSFSMNDNALT